MFIYYFVVRTQKSTIFQFTANSRAFLGMFMMKLLLFLKFLITFCIEIHHYFIYTAVFMCNIRIFVDFVFSCLDCFNRRGLLTVYS